MADMMTFPNTVEEFMEQYKIVDTEEVYTNGADLVPIFRMMQWFEHVSATDTISRQAAIDALHTWFRDGFDEDKWWNSTHVLAAIEGLPPAPLGTNLAEVGTRTVRGYPIDADALMEKVAEEYGERARDTLYRIIRYMPPAQPKQHIDADGTLWITVTDIERVTRVIVYEDKSKFCRQFYMDAKPEQLTDLLKAEIKRMKRSFTICINRDYYTGYMSALSAVEGYIAQLEGANNETD